MFCRLLALSSLLSATLGLLTACGGGMEFHVERPHWPGPVAPGPVTVFGKLDGARELTVQGVRFTTDGATVTLDGIAVDAASLRPGEIVRLEGAVEDGGRTGVATHVDGEAAVIGPVETVDAENGRLLVAGQGVRTDLDTVIDPYGWSGILPGAAVRVCGWRDASGDILATRIEPAADDDVRVVGTVAHLDFARGTFVVDGLTVDYGAALVHLPGAVPVPELRIVASGILVDGVLVAGEIRRALDPRDAGGRVLVEGLVTRLTSDTEFEMAGIPFSADADTWFNHGTRRDLVPGACVVVRGEWAAGLSRVLADLIEFARVP